MDKTSGSRSPFTHLLETWNAGMVATRQVCQIAIFIPPDHALGRCLAGFTYLQVTHALHVLVSGQVLESELVYVALL